MSTNPKGRYAVALVVPEPLRTEINGLRRATGGSLTRIEPHITLVPPINLRHEVLPEVLAHLRHCATLAKGPVTAELGPIATFYPANRVLYVAVSPSADLNTLYTALNAGPLIRHRVSPEQAERAQRPFVPHITINNRFQRAPAPSTHGMQPDDPAPSTYGTQPAEPALPTHGTQPADPTLAAAINTLGHYQATTAFSFLTLLSYNQEAQVWETAADVAFGRRVVVGQGGLGLELTTSTVIDPQAATWLEQFSDTARTSTAYTSQRVIVVTARRENRVVGLATINREGRLGWLESLFVEPNLRRQGIGTSLYRQAIYAAQSHGVAHILPATPLK